MTPLDNDSRKVQQSDSSKQPQRENSEISPPPPNPTPQFKRGGHRPPARTLKTAPRALVYLEGFNGVNR